MADGRNESGRTNGIDQDSIAADTWVGEVDQRRRAASGIIASAKQRWDKIPRYLQWMILVALLASFPIVTSFQPVLDLLDIGSNAFIVRIGAMFLAMSMLAIGLNVVVGYAGLFDLGYAAFFGFAGYAYAYLSSEFIGSGIHVHSILSIPTIVLLTAGFGYLLGLSSLRLRGDYLAIVTLGFGLLFVQLALTLNRVELPWLDKAVDLTNGPNGISNLDNINLLGYTISSNVQYYYLFLLLLIGVYLLVTRMRSSRIGRAWRSIREDELASEVLGTPTRHLKLLAFAIGAGIAGLSGSVFAAWQGIVTPNRYDTILLIELYAMVVLGGLGSLRGVILGTLVFTAVPEVLRNVSLAGVLVYSTILITLFLNLRPWRKFAAFLGATIVAGLLLKMGMSAFLPYLDSGTLPEQGSILNQLVQAWLVVPPSYELVGKLAAICTVFLVLGTVVTRGTWRMILLGLTLYLFAFTWEARLASEPAVTRVLLVGLTLIVIMIKRPQGLLGKLRVTIV